MSRPEKFPHYVSRTRKDHICGNCGKIIPKGTKNVRYRNTLTGKRDYYHRVDDCIWS